MLKTILLLFLFFVNSMFSFSQESSLKLTIPMGPYAVGFKPINTYDYSRSFLSSTLHDDAISGTSFFRPMQIGIWYPAKENDGKANMTYEEYFYLQAMETGIVVITDEFKKVFLEEFIKTEPVSNSDFYKELKIEMDAVQHAIEANGSFPVIIYGPSWSSTSFENALMFEFLASHGYIVISSPSMGPDTRMMPLDEIGVETQARDLEFLISQIHDFPNADINKLTLMGFSLGGLSNVYTMARNKSIDAWIGLDPSIHEVYEMFEASSYNNYTLFSAPSLFINSLGFMHELPFYDKLVYSDAYMVNFPKIEHTELASQFIKLYGDDQSRNKEAMEKRNKAYNLVCAYVLSFLDGVFEKNLTYDEMINKVFNSNDIDNSFISIQSKNALPKPQVLFDHYKDKNITALLSESNELKKIPEDDIQQLIALFAQEDLVENAIELMKWFVGNYDVEAYKNVLNLVNENEMVNMFTEIYKTNNDQCHFTYYELNHTGQLFSMGDRKEEALQYFELNVKLNPGSFKAYFNLGIGYFRLNDLENAQKQFNNCLKNNPNNQYLSLANEFIRKCKEIQ